MKKLYEYLDSLRSPYECFAYDTQKDRFPIRSHWHHFVEILYMLEGQVTTESDGITYEAKKGDLILFHSKSIHSVYNDLITPAKYLILQFDLYSLNRINTESTSFRSLLSHAKDDPNASILLKAHELEPFPIEYILRECMYEKTHFEYGYDLIMTGNISHLLTYILRIWRTHGFDTGKVMEANKEETEFDQILEYIDAHSNEALLVTDLAKRCNMSYSNFAKLFKQFYGKSCKDYIEFIKISKTQDMLLFTDYDLNYISQEAGFSDCSHFIKTYKKVTGITPKQHKLQLLKKK